MDKDNILKQLGVEHKKMKIAPPLVNADCFCCAKDCPACAALKVVEHYEHLIEQAHWNGFKAGVNDRNERLKEEIPLIQEQARQDGRREVIKEIDNHKIIGENSFSKTILFEDDIAIYHNADWWKTLKQELEKGE